MAKSGITSFGKARTIKIRWSQLINIKALFDMFWYQKKTFSTQSRSSTSQLQVEKRLIKASELQKKQRPSWPLHHLRYKYEHRGEAAIHKHLREHDQKATLSSDIKKSKTRLKFAKARGFAKTPVSKNLRSSKFESHALTIQPQKLKIPKKLATNNAATYANKLPIPCNKSSTKYKKIQFCM